MDEILTKRISRPMELSRVSWHYRLCIEQKIASKTLIRDRSEFGGRKPVQEPSAQPATDAPDGSRPHGERTDEQLMVAFVRGHADSFNQLFERYRQPLFGFFRRRLYDPSQAEELTQETFLAVLRGTARYEATALFRTWLYAIGFKILRAHRRKAAFRAMFSGLTPAHRDPAAPGDLDNDLLIRDTVRKLDRIDREILLLREFEQLTYAEIATLLRVPVNTVRSRLFRARTELRQLFSAPAPTLLPQETEQLTRSEGRA
jgi:RNA polymerase sigma factor (sigma-70 family)